MGYRLTDLPPNVRAIVSASILSADRDARSSRPALTADDVRAVAFDVPVKTVAGMNVREHYMARKRRVAKERAATATAIAGVVMPPLPVTVRLVRRSAGTMDDDGIPPACKSIRDEIAARYGVGDSPHDPIVWRYGQERCKRGEYGVRVEIIRGEPS